MKTLLDSGRMNPRESNQQYNVTLLSHTRWRSLRPMPGCGNIEHLFRFGQIPPVEVHRIRGPVTVVGSVS